MTLLDRDQPDGAARRHRRSILSAEQRMQDATDTAVRDFLARVRAAVTPQALVAATGDLFPQAAHLFTLGEASGWWEQSVAEHIAPQVAAIWRSGYFDARDGVLVTSSQDAIAGYLSRVTDRLSRTATPTIPEQAFDTARLALTDEIARGASIPELSQRLAAEFGWDEDATFWRARQDDIMGQIDRILDPLGEPGDPAREAARLNDPLVRDLQQQNAEAVRHIDATQSQWETRADRIARTETTAAYNAGALDAGRVEQAGVKVWLATGDDRTRDTHLEASNTCVPLDGTFDVGGAALQMPGDPSGPPEETINCRCTVVFADDCGEAEELYPLVVDPEQAHEQALADEAAAQEPEAAPEPDDDMRA